ETWIKPENNVTPAALSTNYAFSYTPRPSGRGGGTGLLISDNWKFTPLLPSNRYASFEYHAIMVTALVKTYVIVIYRPPGQLGDNHIGFNKSSYHNCMIFKGGIPEKTY